MKRRMLLVLPMTMVIVSAFGVWTKTTTAPPPRATGRPGVNLNRGRFKLSSRDLPTYGRYRSNTKPYEERWYTTTTARYPPVTMQPAGTWYSTTSPSTTTQPPTTDRPPVNLNGKMFTLSGNGGGGLTLSSPNYSPQPSSSSPYRYTTTRPYHTTTRPYHTTTRPMTTQPSTAGVSVCLRYLTDSVGPQITLDSSRRYRLSFGGSPNSWYRLSCDRYSSTSKSFLPNIKFWPALPAPDVWTSVCLSVDTVSRVAQVFSGSNMSIRKLLPYGCSWTGEPVMDISAFEGQLTDVQVWDYPLLYREVINYMSTSAYKLYRGSVITWSDINFSLNGDGRLEDVYELQAKEPIGGKGRGGGRGQLRRGKKRMDRQKL